MIRNLLLTEARISESATGQETSGIQDLHLGCMASGAGAACAKR